MAKNKKRGRPTVLPEARTERVTFRLTPKEAETFRQYAWRFDMSEADVVRWALNMLCVVPDWRVK